jgi:hypothetical protein
LYSNDGIFDNEVLDRMDVGKKYPNLPSNHSGPPTLFQNPTLVGDAVFSISGETQSRIDTGEAPIITESNERHSTSVQIILIYRQPCNLNTLVPLSTIW